MSTLISIIIPTHERPDRVLRALQSLSEQDIDSGRFEVLVIDDGSTYDADPIRKHAFPFKFTFHRKPQAGATIARNYGVDRAVGEVLIFMDDDVTASRYAVSALIATLTSAPKRLSLAHLIDRAPAALTTAEALNETKSLAKLHASADREVNFTVCNTQMLAVRRSDYEALGRLQDPTGGWPNWDDVDFGYRAHQGGYAVVCSGKAVAVHWDAFRGSMNAANQRWQRASHSAARLFERHPGLQAHIPMFNDKSPVQWGSDSLVLILRKFLRWISVRPAVFALLEWSAARFGSSRGRIRRVTHRWLRGAYIYRGFQRGLADLNISKGAQLNS